MPRQEGLTLRNELKLEGVAPIIYDCEIVNAIQGRDEEMLEGITYCEGWRDFKGMGLSVTCAYEYATDKSYVFMDDNLAEFQKLIDRSTHAITFNGVNFDNHLLAANNINTDALIQYDILREIWKALGFDPDKFDKSTHGKYGLEACCELNFGLKKSGNGALAPVDWQRGLFGKVINYCADDVHTLTKPLFEKAFVHGYILNPNREGDTNTIILPHIKDV